MCSEEKVGVGGRNGAIGGGGCWNEADDGCCVSDWDMTGGCTRGANRASIGRVRLETVGYGLEKKLLRGDRWRR